MARIFVDGHVNNNKNIFTALKNFKIMREPLLRERETETETERVEWLDFAFVYVFHDKSTFLIK